MPKKKSAPAEPKSKRPTRAKPDTAPAPSPSRPSPLLDTRVIYCGDNLEQLQKLPSACIDLIFIDPPFNSNRNYEVNSAQPAPTLPRLPVPSPVALHGCCLVSTRIRPPTHPRRAPSA